MKDSIKMKKKSFDPLSFCTVRFHSLFRFSLVIVALFGFRLSAVAFQEAVVLPARVTLKTAMQSAVEHSFALKSAEANLRSSEYNKSQTAREFGPVLSTNASGIWKSPPPLAAPNAENREISGSLTVTQPLLGLLTLAHTLAQNQIGIEISQEMRKQTKIQAALTGAVFYLNVQLAMQKVSIAEANLVMVKKSQEDAKSQYEAGSLYKDDYLRIVLEQAQAEQTLNSARLSLKTARFALAQAIGLADESQLQVVEGTPCVFCDKVSLLLPSLSDAKQIALRNNESLKIAQDSVNLARANKTIASDAELPSISAFLNYTRNWSPNGSSQLPVAVASPKQLVSYGLQLTWTIWDFGARQAAVDSLAEQVVSKAADENTQKEGLLNQVVEQYDAIQNDLSAIDVSQTSLRVASEAYDLVSYRFLNGQVSALDLITARENIVNARASLSQARFNLDLDWITFQTTLGQDPTLSDVP